MQQTILIAAMGGNRVIGAGDGMPWNVPEEYAGFLRHVRGQTVLMGRRSWEIFGPDLTDSRNLVLTRGQGPFDGADPVASLAEARRIATETLFVAGGASVYRLALPEADAMYLSTIHGDFVGDASFPEFDAGDWTVRVETVHERFTYREYVRR